MQTSYVDDDTARRMWWASLEVVQKDFLNHNYHNGGIWVASPLPALNEKKFFNKLQGWLWSPEGFPYFKGDTAGLLPGDYPAKSKKFTSTNNYKVLNLNPRDGYNLSYDYNSKFPVHTNNCWRKGQKNLINAVRRKSLKSVIELIHAKFCQENSDEGINFRLAINKLGDLNKMINLQFNFS